MAYYWKPLLAVFTGTMLCTAVLTGALMLGDSLRSSLQSINSSRLGRTEYALASQGTFFKADLSDRFNRKSDLITSSVIQTNGIAVIDGGKLRLNNIRVYGVGDGFWEFRANEKPHISIPAGSAAINQQLARRSGLKKGDEFILRLEKSSFIPAETALAQKESAASEGLRLRVHEIVPASQLGNFSLEASQLPPLNVFVSRNELSAKIGMQDRANILLAAGSTDKPGRLTGIDQTLKSVLTFDDLGLELKDLPEFKAIELKSREIFLSTGLSGKALAAGRNAIPVFSYFINEFSCGERQTPYSFIAGLDKSALPLQLADDEIVINQWLADDLDAKVGQKVDLKYYVIGPMKALAEKTASFKIREIVPIEGFAADMDLMMDFPGMSKEESCKDWNPGIPIDMKKIRGKDEDYWKKYKGTPKAFVNFTIAQQLWSNRYGNLTAVRYPMQDNSGVEISEALLKSIDLGEAGLQFENVKHDALAAAKGSVDFGQLFMGLSFFIIISSLLLLSVFFSLYVEQRRPDMAVLLSLGFRPSSIEKLFLFEGFLVALLGTAAGIFAGILYLKSVIYLLGTLWQGAVGNTILKIHIGVPTLAMGFAISLLLAIATMWFTARRHLKLTAARLLSESNGLTEIPRGNSRLASAVFWISLAGAIVMLASALEVKGKGAADMFFGTGFFLLISGIGLFNVLLGHASRKMSSRFDVASMIIQNMMRRRGRNLSVLALMAVGIFLVYSVGVNRHSPLTDQNNPKSGTGGFQLYCESTLPILYDLDTQKGKAAYGLDGEIFKDAKFAQLRLKPGDDASCLNLNRVSNPALLGVDPKEFSDRKAFSFVRTADKISADDAWAALDKTSQDAIPVIADQSTIMWSLGKSVGDTLDYTDGNGNPFKVRLIASLDNSIFQGRILLSSKYLEMLYPSIGGTRVLLVDAPAGSVKELQKQLLEKFEDLGLDAMPASERLAEFNKVENTYLDIFLMLGALGFAIGTVGLGAMTMKNILERKTEFAVMEAVGFSRKRIMRILLLEHSALVGAGLLCGLASALVAVAPSLLEQGAGIPWTALFLISAIIVANIIFWIVFSLKLAMPLKLLDSLKDK